MNTSRLTANEIKELLNLQPHPEEGGFYVETYRSTDEIHPDALPNRYAGKRMFGTGIYYLLTPDTFSAMHRLQSDEIFHFYLGDPGRNAPVASGRLRRNCETGNGSSKGREATSRGPAEGLAGIAFGTGRRVRPSGRDGCPRVRV